MAFNQEPARTPSAIADIEVCLYSPDPTGAGAAGATYSIQVRYSDDSIRVIKGDLVPHLTPQQGSALLAFMDAIRVKANAEILPASP